jgi:chromosome segregation ATPase
MVRRQLVLNQSIEQSILIKDRGTAIRAMYDGPRLRNVKQAFAINDKKRGWGFRLGFTGNEGRAIGPVYPPQGKPRMKTDVESRIAYERDTLQQLEREVQDLERSRQRLQQNVQRCEAAILQHKREQGRLMVASQRADDIVEGLNAELDSLEIDEGHLDSLRSDLAEAQDELRIAEEAYGVESLERDPLNRESAAKKRDLDAVKLRVAEQESKLNKARNKVRNTEQARRMILDDTNTASVAIAQAEAAKEAAENDRQERVARLADFIEQASKISPRVPVPPGETHSSLAAKYEQLRLQKERFKKRMGATEDEITRAAEETDQRYQSRKQSQDSLKELLVLLKQSFMKRIEMFQRFQRHISASSRINFTYLLSERAFRGKLTIDHRNKRLDVHVEPDETNKSGKGRQTKSLSGGEKSFSSICLLLSLWEAMGAPLRCLDEFDVFMDDVNRDVSTKMLVSTYSNLLLASLTLFRSVLLENLLDDNSF